MKNKVVEMARLINDEFNQEFYSKLVAITLHNAGYRKQSDTVREFATQIIQLINKRTKRIEKANGYFVEPFSLNEEIVKLAEKYGKED